MSLLIPRKFTVLTEELGIPAVTSLQLCENKLYSLPVPIMRPTVEFGLYDSPTRFHFEDILAASVMTVGLLPFATKFFP